MSKFPRIIYPHSDINKVWIGSSDDDDEDYKQYKLTPEIKNKYISIKDFSEKDEEGLSVFSNQYMTTFMDDMYKKITGQMGVSKTDFWTTSNTSAPAGWVVGGGGGGGGPGGNGMVSISGATGGGGTAIGGIFTSPVAVSSSPAFPGVAVTTSVESDEIGNHPINNILWKRCDSSMDATITGVPASLIRSNKAMEIIQKYSHDRIFIARSQEVRSTSQDTFGHIEDPWYRSLHDYEDKFRIISSSRQEIKVESNSCVNILVWEVSTTVKGIEVILIIWEQVRLSYVRKKVIDAFVESLNPHGIKTDITYEV